MCEMCRAGEQEVANRSIIPGMVKVPVRLEDQSCVGVVLQCSSVAQPA